MREKDIFKAIADPTRRQIISLLTQEAMPMNAIAERFPDISRPAVSKHVKVLTDIGLIAVYKDGRERFCHASLEPLKEVSDWVAQYERFWNQKLDNLGDYLKQKYGKKK
ncbi:MAG: helix-turn-helix transcriptional regulator [Cyanothece sp. SIO1E1]|nr:helix-turn-helix transcriptional regulator [Cyanothece sp. SIO1E1]